MIPNLMEKNGQRILMVNDRPYIMLAGEVHNSASSSLEYMEQIWKKADMLGMNSLLLPVTWELIEPEEGKFDFSLVDGLIAQARENRKKVGFLWFGAWKNAQCYYAPEWVKKNPEKYRRAEVKRGVKFCCLEDFHNLPYRSLSYLCRETREADAKAFRRLMKHVREVDEKKNTVIVVQVENETGIMGAAREHSAEADQKFSEQVPENFAAYMKQNVDSMDKTVAEAVKRGAESGTWSEVFGESAEEIFSAYYIASYVNEVALAGKEEYPLPMTVNCWLDKGEKPGNYPSGGPVAKMMEVWRYCAPTIDIFCPDIYVPNFVEICNTYMKMNNPLFIPETAVHSYAASRLVYAVGHYHAICYSPFGFEEMGQPFTQREMALFGADIADPALLNPQDTEEYRWFSRTLDSMKEFLGARYGTKALQAVCYEDRKNNVMEFADFGFRVQLEATGLSGKDGVCLILQETEDTFYIVVKGAKLQPFSMDKSRPFIEIISLEEGNFTNEGWKRKRRLNGDEAARLAFEKPALLKLTLFMYR